ncbi:MAG: PAS domain S-box protein [Nitrosomonadales bacterium]|nr:PAS domain S-box protein [Nitrosomonadales bacterium]
MNRIHTTDAALANMDTLRRAAQDRLRQEQAEESSSQQHDIARQLYELRINQIETELLSEEFNRLRQKVSANNPGLSWKEAAENGYLFLNREGRICDAKFPASRHWEIQEGWLTRYFLDDFLPLDRREQFRKFLDETFESDVNISCELPFEQAGRNKRLRLNLPLYGLFRAVADERKIFCLVVVEDISARKFAEDREKASNAALHMLDKTISASRNEIYMCDARTRHFTFANRRALENLGYTMEELQALTPNDIQASFSDEEAEELNRHVLSNKNSVRKFNSLHRRKDGSLYPVEVFLQFFEQELGGSLLAIVLDTSSQTAIESQLKSIVESASAIIWAADIDLNLVFVSDQVRDMLGYNTDMFVGHTLVELLDAELFHASDREKLMEGFNRVIRDGGKVSDLRYRARHADGTWRWLSMNMTPNRAVDGQVAQVVGVMHDIHAQKLAEEALIRLNRELDTRVREEIQKNMEKDALLQRQSRLAGMGEMIGNIAHQWRQPINSLGLILSDLEDSALYGECDLAYIKTAVGKSKKIIQKMSSTIDDFRHFFRADKSMGIFSLKQVTDECINLLDASMKNNHINIVVRCGQDVAVNGYANEYSQAVMNILSNAKDAIVARKIEAGEIVIEIGEEGEFAVHSVTDNGGGIPREVLPRIFEPHFTTKENGVGIGLYMTLVTIEKNMKGRIEARNVAGGARFTVYLPRAATGSEHVIH